MNNVVIYPGTFDPITNGHIDIITRAGNIFPKILVAVAKNSVKQPFFSLDARVKCIQDAIGHLSGVTVMPFDTLLVDFAREQGANIILRGLRTMSDFEYEFQLAGMNRKLSADIETIFLTPSEDSRFISSTLVREIANLGGDVTDFVPKSVVLALKKRSG
ncbi:MAG: pantetheine-phosphate adenylyltransferase [Legionellaceae bacterium]|nr:pantetheine-phosphate adenylyltransferase [Legionellaceae bacterium]MBP9775233.1 pantetheine-phosphate adenylyltransferase [Legionellaceae bacterium]